jgi:hypothetical protein
MKMNLFSGLLTMGFALFALGCDGGSEEGSGTGGINAGGAGGSGATGGSSGAGGSGGGTTGEELVNAEGWVGGDPATPDDDPLGIQGAWYGYGDNTSCADLTGLNPCNATEGCCIDGATVKDPTFAAWGCGIGLSLNATGGTTSVKNAFTGLARNFAVTLTGDTGGLKVRIGFPQAAETAGAVAPYKEIPAVAGSAEATVSFEEAQYPSWCAGNAACDGKEGLKADPASSYDIQFQVPGGESVSTFDFCIKSLKASP